MFFVIVAPRSFSLQIFIEYLLWVRVHINPQEHRTGNKTP